MRVLMMSWEYPPHIDGGLGQHVAAVAPELVDSAANLDLHVITPCFEGREEGDGALQKIERNSRAGRGELTVHYVPTGRPSLSDYFAGVRQANLTMERVASALQAERGFDLLHAHDWLVGFAAMALQAAHHIPLLTTFHATERGRHGGHLPGDLQRMIDNVECRLARASQHIITCSHAMQDEVQRFFGVPSDRFHIIPNGIDTSRFSGISEEALAEFRGRYARPDELLVFNVGRLVYEKGADLLVEAAPRVLQQVPQVRFVIGGRGPWLSMLRERVQVMSLADKVLLTGYLSDGDRDRLYMVADCCVFPSRYEPFGIVALESMAAGTPVVATHVGGLGSVVSHGETGIVVLPDNIESLAWGIVSTLTDREAAARRAARASVTVQQCFAWPVIGEMTLEAYRQASSQLACD